MWILHVTKLTCLARYAHSCNSHMALLGISNHIPLILGLLHERKYTHDTVSLVKSYGWEGTGSKGEATIGFC